PTRHSARWQTRNYLNLLRFRGIRSTPAWGKWEQIEMHPAGTKTAETPPQTPSPNERRRRVRHRVHIPAYSSVDSSDTGMILDLSEILDISEDGMLIQTSSPLRSEEHTSELQSR